MTNPDVFVTVPIYQNGRLVGTAEIDPLTYAEREALIAELSRLRYAVTNERQRCVDAVKSCRHVAHADPFVMGRNGGINDAVAAILALPLAP